MYGEESIGEPGEKGGVAYKVVVYVVLDWQGPSHNKEEEHTAAADQQFAADGFLQQWKDMLVEDIVGIKKYASAFKATFPPPQNVKK